MKVALSDLLGRGYFPAELPLPFTTIKYSNLYRKMFLKSPTALARGPLSSSECTFYSIPKAALNRRILGIPNPLHFSILSETICSNQNKINKLLNSQISCSAPMADPKSLRAVKQKLDYGSFRRHCFLISNESSYELKVDISRYYSTIYTHIIPWALHTRTVAKQRRNDPTLLGNVLDGQVRNLQSGQTMGIPIGPDTSLIVSELIGARLDACLKEQFPEIKGARYVDDFYLYFSKRADAEKALKTLQSIFSDYLLSNNEEKTAIKEFPFSTDPVWLVSLRSLKATCFKDSTYQEQESDIRQFFSAAFDWAEKYPKDEVLKFAAKHLLGVSVSAENWDYFQGWLIKMGLYDPYTLPEICLILYTNKAWVLQRALKPFIYELLDKHTSKRHSFEVSWALWLAKLFSVKIPSKLAISLFTVNDPIPTIIALDMRHNGLISKKVKTSALKIDLSEDALRDGRWILAYEAFIKGWLRPNKAQKNFIRNHQFFSRLYSKRISFYDGNILPRYTRSKALPKSWKKIIGHKSFSGDYFL